MTARTRGKCVFLRGERVTKEHCIPLIPPEILMQTLPSLQLYRAQQQAKKVSKKMKQLQVEELDVDKQSKNITDKISVSPSKNSAQTLAMTGFSKLLMEANKAAEAERKTVDTPSKNSFYWSESMDVKLAQAVHNCVFDFAAVSIELQRSMTKQDLGENLDVMMLTEASCRERWCELDMDDTSEVNFSADVKPNIMLGKGGRQLSFAELQSSVNMQVRALKRVQSKI